MLEINEGEIWPSKGWVWSKDLSINLRSKSPRLVTTDITLLTKDWATMLAEQPPIEPTTPFLTFQTINFRLMLLGLPPASPKMALFIFPDFTLVCVKCG